MIIVYGSKRCPDCVAAEKAFAEKNITYEYRDITENLSYLKEFLAIRDKSPVFDEIRSLKGIGIPCIIEDGGEPELDAEKFLGAKIEGGAACSLDKTGC